MPNFPEKRRHMKKRTIVEGEVHHVYQRTGGGVVVFYSIRDYLVFFTIVCTMAEQEDVTLLALCPMPDHLHNACRVKNHEQLARFVQQYTRIYSHEWNTHHARKGSLFQNRFGSAPKVGNKKVRTCINYVYNNPVERKMVQNAEQYRWNFLAYARCRNPFSRPIILSQASRPLRGALAEAKKCRQEGQWLHYAQLDRWMRKLSAAEIQQLTDAIVGLWNIIDYEDAISYYGSRDAMVRSFHDNTGSEYDIREDTDKYSDAVYADCNRILLHDGFVRSVREIPSLPLSSKLELYHLLVNRTAAKPGQVRKYLHFQSALFGAENNQHLVDSQPLTCHTAQQKNAGSLGGSLR